MKIRLANWKVTTLKSRFLKINPAPQYQRTSVWSVGKKRLLIDSMLRGYDLPKFYLRATPNDPLYDFEVTDGQQRIRAILEFMSDDENQKYHLDQAIIEGVDTDKLLYSDLGLLKESFDNYDLDIAIIEDSSPEEIRSLFARLQMGAQLNQVELRHALASNIGAAIYSVVETHVFFKKSKINNNRFKHQDYLDHVIALAYYGGLSDVKAKNIEMFYKELANATSSTFQKYIKKANEILTIMNSLNSLSPGIFKNKWAFVDMFWLLYKNHNLIDSINNEKLIEQLKLFEQKRLLNNKTPEKLINDPSAANYDKDLYNYILAFKYSGNVQSNIALRHKVYFKKFINNGIYLNN